jgi:TRAP-type mannitol/chloroaromatic compound transport system substrate-binding protein
MLETKQQFRSPILIDPATPAECLGFIRAAIATADPETARDVAAVLREVCTSGHADLAQIWQAFTQSEPNQYRELLAPLPILQDFAKRILEVIGWQSPGVAGGVDGDLQAAIDRGEFDEAELVGVVGDRHFLDFQELVARCPKYFSEVPAPSIKAATKKIS